MPRRVPQAVSGRSTALPPFRLIGICLALAAGNVLAQSAPAEAALPAITVVGDTLGDLPAVNPGGQT
ncbi:MAG: hypothetical protein EOO24_42640, partial [Comamonadaceae bacterium]